MWWDVSKIDRQTLSDLAGSASFFVWLFAQSPQLYENYRNSSCDGLSVVFLIQWMAGDITNLIGCLLTQQLPFQVAVATYFCCIDLCILMQYYYYWRRDQLLARESKDAIKRTVFGSYMSSSVPNMRSSSILPSTSRARRTSQSRSPRREPSQMMRANSKPTIPRIYDSTQSVQALSERARNMTDLADEYAQRVHSEVARRRLKWRMGRGKLLKKVRSKGAANSMKNAEDEEAPDAESVEVPSHMTNSILSDSSNDDFGYGFGTASAVLNSIPQGEVSNERGRDMTRKAGKLGTNQSPMTAEGLPIQAARTKSTLQSLRSMRTRHGTDTDESLRGTFTRSDSTRSMQSPATRRGAGMVLLGFAAVFALQGSRLSSGTIKTIEDHSNERAYVIPKQVSAAGLLFAPSIPLSWHRLDITKYYTSQKIIAPPPPVPPTWERIVGRISAWTCTVLYMTSRLPQIWTNLNRRSVQGLSILLFLSAALGNALYSLSVLVNPLASGNTRFEYLWESLPFLLGSGGTLIFDAVIVFQWVAWRGKEPLMNDIDPEPSIMTSSFVRSASRTASRHRNVNSHWTTLESQPLLEHL